MKEATRCRRWRDGQPRSGLIFSGLAYVAGRPGGDPQAGGERNTRTKKYTLKAEIRDALAGFEGYEDDAPRLPERAEIEYSPVTTITTRASTSTRWMYRMDREGFTMVHRCSANVSHPRHGTCLAGNAPPIGELLTPRETAALTRYGCRYRYDNLRHSDLPA